jgi:hypothetical protein
MRQQRGRGEIGFSRENADIAGTFWLIGGLYLSWPIFCPPGHLSQAGARSFPVQVRISGRDHLSTPTPAATARMSRPRRTIIPSIK